MRDLKINFKVHKVLKSRKRKACCVCDKVILVGSSSYSVYYSLKTKSFNGDLCSEECRNKFTEPLKHFVKLIKSNYKNRGEDNF